MIPRLRRATNHVTCDVVDLKNGKAWPMEITYTQYFHLLILNLYWMNDMLVVPSATKNLMAVYRFCVDNSVAILFNPQTVVVKDLE